MVGLVASEVVMGVESLQAREDWVLTALAGELLDSVESREERPSRELQAESVELMEEQSVEEREGTPEDEEMEEIPDEEATEEVSEDCDVLVLSGLLVEFKPTHCSNIVMPSHYCILSIIARI